MMQQDRLLLFASHRNLWNDGQSGAWTLNPVIADPEFRALDCRDNPPTEEIAR